MHAILRVFPFMSATRSQQSAKLFHLRATVFLVGRISGELKAKETEEADCSYHSVFFFLIPDFSLAFVKVASKKVKSKKENESPINLGSAYFKQSEIIV